MAAADASAQQQPVTPFARASVHRAVGETAAAGQVRAILIPAILWMMCESSPLTGRRVASHRNHSTTPHAFSCALPRNAPRLLPQQQVGMTVEAVDHALDDVRPYLIADGGNVEVVAVENGRVFLQLQVRRPCCPASWFALHCVPLCSGACGPLVLSQLSAKCWSFPLLSRPPCAGFSS